MSTDTPQTIMMIPHGTPRTAAPSSAARATSRLAAAANADPPGSPRAVEGESPSLTIPPSQVAAEMIFSAFDRPALSRR